MLFAPLDIPDALLEAQERGKLVVFAGAGVSMGKPSNLPSFKQLAADIAGSHPLAGELEKYGDRLDRFLGDLFRNGVDVQGLCRSRIEDPTSKPNELHRLLIDLFPDPAQIRIVTTNFDNHFATVLRRRGIHADSYCAPALPLGNQFSGLVYIHGSLARSEPLVLTGEDFGRAYLTEGWARFFLQRLFQEFTTLFVGYSHNDLPVEYLARGMSGGPLAPKFALVGSGDAGQWTSLGIREITFEKLPASAGNPYINLYKGLRKWATFTKQQPTDVAEKVQNIVASSKTLQPDKMQSDLLKRCLRRGDSCHFFLQHAKGWQWISWLHREGLLERLLGSSRVDLSEPESQLASWLGKELLAVKSEEGLLLIEANHGQIALALWEALLRELWLNEDLDWNDPTICKWALFVTDKCPQENVGQLAHIFDKAAKFAPDTLGLVVLRRLTVPRVLIKRGFDFDFAAGDLNNFRIRDKSELEVQLPTHVHGIEQSWESFFKPRIPLLKDQLLNLFEERIRETVEIYRAIGRANHRDALNRRSQIHKRSLHRLGSEMDVVLDLMLGVIDATSKTRRSVGLERIESWLRSDVPVLIRVGLYALLTSQSIPKSKKVALVLDLDLVYPRIFGAKHESWLILVNCYSSLSRSNKKRLWTQVKKGPKCPENLRKKDWEDVLGREVDDLTWMLAMKNKRCRLGAGALKQLRKRNPGFKPYRELDQSYPSPETPDTPISPRSTADLLAQPPKEQINFLLSYKGEKALAGDARKRLLASVGTACAQNADWALALMQELDARSSWTSDLWSAAFYRLSISSLPQDRLTWLLRILKDHLAESPCLQSLNSFLFHSIDLYSGKRPTAENLELMIELSLLIWKQIKGTESAVKDGFEKEEWSDRVLNHSAGVIAEFWVKCLQIKCLPEGQPPTGFPDWVKQPLSDMLEGADFASQLGRAVLGLNLPLIHHIDSAWTEANLFPKLQFSKLGTEAFLLWEPYVCCRKLSRGLILAMLPLYREAFPYFRGVGEHLMTGFLGHITTIIYSCLVDVNENGWFREFLLGLSDEERVHWARQMWRALDGAPENWKRQIWEQWMRSYWTDRVRGRPCPLAPAEAEEMLEWAFVVGDAFPEAVEILLRGPSFPKNMGPVAYELEKHSALVKFPEAVLKLVEWLLKGDCDRRMISAGIEKLIFSLPKKQVFVPTLQRICQRLASFGYSRVVALKARIGAEFKEA